MPVPHTTSQQWAPPSCIPVICEDDVFYCVKRDKRACLAQEPTVSRYGKTLCGKSRQRREWPTSSSLVSASSPAIERSTRPVGVFSHTQGHRHEPELQHTGSVMVRPQSEHFSCASVSVFGHEVRAWVRACLNCVQLLDYSYLRRPETLLWHYVLLLLLWLPRSCLQQQPRPGYCSPYYEEPLPPLCPRMWRLLASLTSVYRPSKCGILWPEPMNLDKMSRWCCSRKDHILFQKHSMFILLFFWSFQRHTSWHAIWFTVSQPCGVYLAGTFFLC